MVPIHKKPGSGSWTKRSRVMACVGTWKSSPKCYACDIGLHLQPFIGNGEIEMSSTGRYKHNQWMNQVFNIHIPMGMNISPYKYNLKREVFRMNHATFLVVIHPHSTHLATPYSDEISRGVPNDSHFIQIIDSSYLYYACIKCMHSFGSLKRNHC
jgi:hypothetical protein